MADPKILVVDNHTKNLSKLRQLIEGDLNCWSSFISYDILFGLDDNVINNFDLIILSGGKLPPIFEMALETSFTRQLEIINNSNIPIIGICYGAEIIAQNFGALLVKSKKIIKGINQIKILDTEDPVFQKYSHSNFFGVWEEHRYVIQELPSDLIGIGISESGWEIFGHRSKLIYGLQYHPEKNGQIQSGDDIFINLVKNLLNSKNKKIKAINY